MGSALCGGGRIVIRLSTSMLGMNSDQAMRTSRRYYKKGRDLPEGPSRVTCWRLWWSERPVLKNDVQVQNLGKCRVKQAEPRRKSFADMEVTSGGCGRGH